MTVLMMQITVAFALIATALSCGLWLLFRRSTITIGRRVGHMLFGEFISCVVFAIFATLELRGHLQTFPIWASTLMRWVALAFMFRSSVLLAIETDRLIRAEHDKQRRRDEP